MYQKELLFIKNTIKKTYQELIKTPLEIMEKGKFDTVTNLDYLIEKTLIEHLKDEYPNDNIISEEFNPTNQVNGRTWVIDPIDGTVNFARGSVYFGIQLALFNEGEVVLSYMYFPRLDEEYYALINQGAYYKDQKLIVTPRKVNEMIMSFGDFFVNVEKDNRFTEHLLLGLKDNIFRTRFQGSAAIDTALVIKGVNDGLVLRTNNLWDLAPGYLLLKEAGCVIVNELVEEYHFSDYALFAFNNKEILPLLRKVLLE